MYSGCVHRLTFFPQHWEPSKSIQGLLMASKGLKKGFRGPPGASKGCRGLLKTPKVLNKVSEGFQERLTTDKASRHKQTCINRPNLNLGRSQPKSGRHSHNLADTRLPSNPMLVEARPHLVDTRRTCDALGLSQPKFGRRRPNLIERGSTFAGRSINFGQNRQTMAEHRQTLVNICPNWAESNQIWTTQTKFVWSNLAQIWSKSA